MQRLLFRKLEGPRYDRIVYVPWQSYLELGGGADCFAACRLGEVSNLCLLGRLACIQLQLKSYSAKIEPDLHRRLPYRYCLPLNVHNQDRNIAGSMAETDKRRFT